MEPRYNKRSRDWHFLFAITRFCYIEVLFHIFYYYWGKENRSLHRGLCCIEVHYIEVPLYKAILFQFLDCFSLVFFKKDSPLHPRLYKFPGWIDCKATYKAKGAASTLKRLETWRETNAPLWLWIGCIIFPIDMKIQSFTIILIGHIIFFMCLRHC